MRVLLVGDLHANTAWLERAVVPTGLRHDADVILQLGDFGWWPGQPSGDRFIEAAQRSPIPLWWIDGNHEHHHDLAQRVEASAKAGMPTAVHLGGNLTHLPRGTRIDLTGVGGVGCGGAHSIDRQLRNPGQSWFATERLSDADIQRCAAGGHADILFSHDAPTGWEIPGLIPDEDLAPRLKAELASCWSHRALLEQVFDAVTPSLVVHGHYHSGYSMTFDAAWGPVQVVGLDCDGTSGNLALLDCNDGAWTILPVEASR